MWWLRSTWELDKLKRLLRFFFRIVVTLLVSKPKNVEIAYCFVCLFSLPGSAAPRLSRVWRAAHINTIAIRNIVEKLRSQPAWCYTVVVVRANSTVAIPSRHLACVCAAFWLLPKNMFVRVLLNLRKNKCKLNSLCNIVSQIMTSRVKAQFSYCLKWNSLW